MDEEEKDEVEEIKAEDSDTSSVSEEPSQHPVTCFFCGQAILNKDGQVSWTQTGTSGHDRTYPAHRSCAEKHIEEIKKKRQEEEKKDNRKRLVFAAVLIVVIIIIIVVIAVSAS